MNIEEKAKAYDEVFERVKPLYEWAKKDDSPMWSTYEYLFPQLAESEDERIRKHLIDIVETYWGKTNEPGKAADLAYLEKQKEAGKAIEAVERIDKYIDEHLANAHDMKDSNPDKKYYRGWDDALGKMAGILQDVYSGEKQKESLRDFIDNFPYSDEQKEPHYTKRNALFDKCVENCDPKIMKRVSDEVDKMLEKEQKPAECSEDIIQKAVKEVGLTQHQIDWFKTNVFPPKVEWSEEDEERIQSILFSVGYCKDEYPNKKDYSKDIAWLKALPLSLKKRNEDVAKLYSNEWSEEDKQKLNRIYEILGYAADDNGFLTSKRIIGDKEAIELQDFLSSLRPHSQQE